MVANQIFELSLKPRGFAVYCLLWYGDCLRRGTVWIGLPVWAIVLIVIGCVLLAAMAALGVLAYLRKKREAEATEETTVDL